MNFYMVYTTAKDKKEADRIAKTLLQKHLIACANMFRIRSLYRWRGDIQDEGEVALIMKTTEGHMAEIINVIKSVHSYEVPAVEFLPIAHGDSDFLDWIKNETSI